MLFQEVNEKFYLEKMIFSIILGSKNFSLKKFIKQQVWNVNYKKFMSDLRWPPCKNTVWFLKTILYDKFGLGHQSKYVIFCLFVKIYFHYDFDGFSSHVVFFKLIKIFWFCPYFPVLCNNINGGLCSL